MGNNFSSFWFIQNFHGVSLSGKPDRHFHSAETDSRKVGSSQLFVPIRGERVDGHDFIAQAVERGATVVLVERSWYSKAKLDVLLFSLADFILVDSAMYALQALATWHIEKHCSEIIRIAITGSNGKTTTKAILGSMLKEAAPSFVSEGNRNSDVGLPMEVLKLGAGMKYALFEMGMNRPGEIHELVSIVKPSFALITNIGSAHIEFFQTQEAIALEKKQIFSKMTEEDYAFVEDASVFKDLLISGVSAKLIPFSVELAGFKDIVEQDDGCSRFRYAEQVVHFHFLGEHNLQNAAAATVLAKYAAVPDKAIVAGLNAVRPDAGRFEIVSSFCKLVNDTYNANEESVMAALKWLEKQKEKKHIVLGAMKELGAYSEDAHRNVGRKINSLNFHTVYLIGQDCEFVREEIQHGSVFLFENMEELIQSLKERVSKQDIVWIKGSRSLGLEKLVDSFKEEKSV